MKKFRTLIGILPTVMALSCLTLSAIADEHPGIDIKPVDGSSKAVTLNLHNADIQAFISAIADLTGKNFVIDPRVKGQVTVVSSAPTDPDALYEVFLSVLKVNGFSAIPSGKVIKIVPDLNARQEGEAAVLTGIPGRSERIMTAVIPTRYVNAAELVPVLRPLLPQESHLAATAKADALVIADSSANVERIMHLVRELDHDNANSIEVIKLRFAVAGPLVTTLQQLLATAGNGAPTGTSPIAADERSNSVLLGGTDIAKFRLRTLIQQLDVPGSRSAEKITVIYLRYATAKELVKVLEAIGDRDKAVANQKGSGTGGLPAPSVSSGTSSSANFQVQADEATNALIVQANPELMAQLREVIEKLDIRPAEVLVEGIIAEISKTKTDELGVQWETSVPGTGVFAGSSLPGQITSSIPDPFAKGSAPALLSGLTLGYFSAGSMRALVSALSGDKFTNVLSTPSLTTLNNAEAKIVVGQNVPFVTGQYTNTTTTPGNPFQTIERQDVGVLLKVKPQINEGDTLTLNIEQEVSSVSPGTTGTDLVTDKRSIKTSVLVDDKQIIVLGGLISKELNDNKSQIPLLGNIPVLGHLFSNNNSKSTKTNLMVFLRPTIIRNQKTNKALTDQRYDDIREKERVQDKDGHFFLREKNPILHIDGLAE